MDAEHMTFRGSIFDIIYINSVLMHLNKEEVIKDCKRLLKPKGILVIIEPLNYNPIIVLHRLIFLMYKKTNPDYMTTKKFINLSYNPLR